MDSIRNGVWPTMITPYTEDGKIDYGAVERLLEFYDQRGVDGVFAVCQSSEMFQLSLPERAALARFIAGNTPGRMQVIVSGHIADDVGQQVREAREIFGEGMSAYVILPNRFAAADESDDMLLRRMERFVEGFPGVPLGVYECPTPYKRLLTPKVLRWCVESGRFQFIKDTCCNLEQITEKLGLISGTGIKLFNANSATLLESLRRGASGFSGVMANIHPEFYVWLCRHFRDEPEKAERMQQFVSVCSMAEYQYYPVNAKYALSLQGVPVSSVSRVLDAEQFTGREQLEIRHLVELSQWMRQIWAVSSHQ